MATEQVHTYCPMCVAQCGVIADVEDGRFTKVRPDPEHDAGRQCNRRFLSVDKPAWSRIRQSKSLVGNSYLHMECYGRLKAYFWDAYAAARF
jgi:hypothetical protein